MDVDEAAKKPKAVKLEVTSSLPPGVGLQEKWNITTASDGSTWWYRYKDGNQGEGQNECTVNAGTQSFPVEFVQKSADFRMLAYVNKSSPTDMSGEIAADQKTATVSDSCLNVGDFYWGLIVYHKDTPGVTISCDPITRNRH
jgi:hypothetical protein